MKILILGGTSLTGPFTTRYLVEQGHQVTIFHRGQHEVDLPPAVNRILGERRKLDEFISEFRQLAPDVVLDMLAFTRQDAEMLVRVFKGIAQQSSLWTSAWHRARAGGTHSACRGCPPTRETFHSR